MIPIFNFVIASAIVRSTGLTGPEATRISVLASAIPVSFPVSAVVAKVAAQNAAEAKAAAETPPPKQ